MNLLMCLLFFSFQPINGHIEIKYNCCKEIQSELSTCRDIYSFLLKGSRNYVKKCSEISLIHVSKTEKYYAVRGLNRIRKYFTSRNYFHFKSFLKRQFVDYFNQNKRSKRMFALVSFL